MSDQYHDFSRPIRSVAVIGAGPSGIPAAKHLLEAGFKVRIFERQSAPGGIWTYSPEAPLPTTIPTPPPSQGDFVPREPFADGDGVRQRILKDETRNERLEFNPPNPVYVNLHNNVPTPTMQFKDFPYPPETPWYIRHNQLASYVQSYARHHGIDDPNVASFDTRVEHVGKQASGEWRLNLRKVEETNRDEIQETVWSESFDAVVVATGHYGAPTIPDFKGAKAWVQRWPEHLIHSRAYRDPKTYSGKTVLIVGTGTSGVDIARDLSGHAKHVYQVVRNKLYGPKQYRAQRALQRLFLPSGVEHVSEIASFGNIDSLTDISQAEIKLTDGRVLRNVDQIIFSTGYQYSYPFLPGYHQDSGSLPSDEVLVTSGGSVHNLFRDVFYIPDPTLAFVGVSINTATFSFFEYQSISIARVFSGQARLPNLASRRLEYENRVAERGDGKFLHLLGKEGEIEYVKETVAWLNRDGADLGAEKVQGHSQAWLDVSAQTLSKLAERNGLDLAAVKRTLAELDTVAPIIASRESTLKLEPALAAISVE